MFGIDRRALKSHIKRQDAKSVLGKSESVVSDQYKLEVWNIKDHVETLHLYDMAQWTLSLDRWLQNLSGSENLKKYARGDILMVDLGAANFKYEPSFEHPAVVLINEYRYVYVVPCSSQKYGKNFPEIIDAETTDGFSKPTGIQMNGARWIHKNRVLQTIGSIQNSTLMDRIDAYILKQVPSHQVIVNSKDSTITTLSSRVQQLEEEKKSIETDKMKYFNQMNISMAVIQKIVANNPKLLEDVKRAAQESGNPDFKIV